MGRGALLTRRVRKVHPTAAQSLLPLLLMLLIVRVSTRLNIDFTMKFAENYGVNKKEENSRRLCILYHMSSENPQHKHCVIHDKSRIFQNAS